MVVKEINKDAKPNDWKTYPEMDIKVIAYKTPMTDLITHKIDTWFNVPITRRKNNLFNKF